MTRSVILSGPAPAPGVRNAAHARPQWVRHFYTRLHQRATRARPGRHWRLLATLWVGLAAGCDCGGVPADLRVEGAHPHVRCFAVDPPAAAEWQVGDLQLMLKGRTLRIVGPETALVAAYAGPGFVTSDRSAPFEEVTRARPHMAVMLGGVGDDAELATQNLRFAARAPFPTLVLAGGRDRLADLQQAMRAMDAEERKRVIDGTGLRRVEWGRHVWLLVSGAVNGRYARDSGACGVGESDLDEMAEELDSADGRLRWLFSWQAPADPMANGRRGVDSLNTGAAGVARVGNGWDVGEPILGRFAREVGAEGGVFSWPEVQAGRGFAADRGVAAEPRQVYRDLQIVVPSLAGPALQREDGSWAVPGFMLLGLNTEGMMLVGPD